MKVTEEVFRQLKEMSGQAQLLDGKVGPLKPQLGKTIKSQIGVFRLATKLRRQSRMFKAHIALAMNELDPLKQKDLTDCSMEVVLRKVNSSDQPLLTVSSHLKKNA